MAASVVAGGREFSSEVLSRISATVCMHPERSRSELSRRVCEWLDWQGSDAEPKQVSCRVALLRLHRRGLIELPEPQGQFSRVPKTIRSDENRDPVDCSLAELGDVVVVPVTRFERELNETWKRLMAHHYLGPRPLVGAQMRYLIGSERGWVGALAFSAAAGMSRHATSGLAGAIEPARRTCVMSYRTRDF